MYDRNSSFPNIMSEHDGFAAQKFKLRNNLLAFSPTKSYLCMKK